ncbi:MAG: ShlB/FhaC/HecB family hemolysin secretion/activation protein [Alphaproteobacteria bacterium]
MKPHPLWHVGFLSVLAALPSFAVASTPLPGPANLQRLHDVLRTQALPAPRDISLTLPTLPPPTPNQDKEDARVTLTGVEIQGATLLPAETLGKLLEPISGQETSLAAIDAVVANITHTYRAQGYFLGRANLPPQQFENGRLLIHVVEGRVDDIRVNGAEHVQANALVRSIVARLKAKSTPTSKDVETALLQLNTLPGITAQGTLSPAETPGGAILTLNLHDTQGDVSLGFNNHGTRYIGPNRFEMGATVHNVLAPWGDTLAVQALQDPNGSDLTLVDSTYSLPLNSLGTTASLNLSKGISRPEWTLEDLDINSRTFGAGLTLTQNLHRTRALAWDVYGTLDWADADSTSSGLQLSADHTRTLRLGTRTTTLDDLQGFTTMDAKLSQGLDLLGGTARNSLGSSRLRGTGVDFTKANVDVSRLQRLNEVWNLVLSGSGQYSTHALLAGDEFGLGGPTGFGRGYDSNELTGEHGLAAKAELQATFTPAWPWLDAWQLFGFYDYGAVWNKDRDVLEDNTAKTLASVGMGVRLQFSPNLNAEVMMVKPTTREVQSTNNDNATIYFRLNSKVDFETLGALRKGKPAS